MRATRRGLPQFLFEPIPLGLRVLGALQQGEGEGGEQLIVERLAMVALNLEQFLLRELAHLSTSARAAS
jgi:hypothetical protein